MLAAVSIVAALIAASVAVVVAVLTPAISSLRARREAIDAKFDAAIASLLLVQAARYIEMNIDRSYHPGTDEEHRLYRVTMAESSISRFVYQHVEARTALAAISRYVPEVREWITSDWELTQEYEPEQRRLVEASRTSALKTERLLRQSRHPEAPKTNARA